MTFSVLLACPGPHIHTSLQRWALITSMLRRASFATRLGYSGFSLQRHMCTITVTSTHLLIRGLVEFLHPLEFLLKLAHFVLIHLDLSHNTHTQPVTLRALSSYTWICHTTHTQPVTLRALSSCIWICHTTHTHNLSHCCTGGSHCKTTHTVQQSDLASWNGEYLCRYGF